MTGLEDRLRRVPGVVDLSVEMGEAGVEGLRVRVEPGIDETAVFAEIRRILVAYGLGYPHERPGRRRAPVRRLDAPIDTRPRLTVRPLDGELEVLLVVDDRTVVARGERTPLGAVSAMATVAAEVRHRPPPLRVAVGRDRLDGTDVVTVLVRCSTGAGVGAAIVAPSLTRALFRAAEAAVLTCGE